MGRRPASTTDLRAWALRREQEHLALRIGAIEESLQSPPPSVMADDVAEMTTAELHGALQWLAAEREHLDSVERLVRRLIAARSSH